VVDVVEAVVSAAAATGAVVVIVVLLLLFKSRLKRNGWFNQREFSYGMFKIKLFYTMEL
jgi:hypothetical protein